MPVEVYSGIKPPSALLEAMAKPQGEPSFNQTLRPPQTPGYASHPPSPIMATSQPTTPMTGHPPAVGTAAGPLEAVPDAPPPSYEDAIAEDLAPVDGPRRDYHQPSITPQSSGQSSGQSSNPAPLSSSSTGDEKRGGEYRLQERLFD